MEAWKRIVHHSPLARDVEHLARDRAHVVQAMLSQPGGLRPRTDCPIQGPAGLFYRNNRAYLAGRTIHGVNQAPVAFVGEDEVLMIFSHARAYFMVAMQIPSAGGQFLRSLMPRRPRGPRAERYNALGPNEGRQEPPLPQPDGAPAARQRHAPRCARHRGKEELIDEINHFCPRLREQDGDTRIIKHLFIEPRMVPLNSYLQKAGPEAMAHAVAENGSPIQDEEDEMSGAIGDAGNQGEVFPETLGPFLLGNPQVRDTFLAHHSDLLDAVFWQGHKKRNLRDTRTTGSPTARQALHSGCAPCALRLDRAAAGAQAGRAGKRLSR